MYPAIKERLYLLIDTLLLHGCSLNSSGLYYGKAGLSFSLFCASQYLNDEYIEEQASELLQEALLSEGKIKDFQNGTAGIAYVLILLDKIGWIKANIFELWNEKIQAILEEIHNIQPSISEENFKKLDFLLLIEILKENIQNSEELKKNILNQAETYLLFLFESIENKSNQYSLYKLIITWKHYLSIISNCRNCFPSYLLLNKYKTLYEKGLFPSSLSIGYNLKKIYINNHLNYWETIIQQNIKNDSDFNFCVELKDMLSKLTLLMDHNDVSNFVRKFFFESSESTLEKNLIYLMPEKEKRISFYNGISGVLYFLISYLDHNTPRMDFIF